MYRCQLFNISIVQHPSWCDANSVLHGWILFPVNHYLGQCTIEILELPLLVDCKIASLPLQSCLVKLRLLQQISQNKHTFDYSYRAELKRVVQVVNLLLLQAVQLRSWLQRRTTTLVSARSAGPKAIWLFECRDLVIDERETLIGTSVITCFPWTSWSSLQTLSWLKLRDSSKLS